MVKDFEPRICKGCGNDEFYQFRVAGSTTTVEHWSNECTKCGKVDSTSPVVYLDKEVKN